MMCIERQMFAIVEKCYDLFTLQYKTRQILSIRTEALIDLVRNTSHYADMRADVAFLSSESLECEIVYICRRCLKCFPFFLKKISP